ncbi:hypothetical protein SAMN05216308_11166 [Nitrosospira sp. Nsp13]|nr:hypothetical protein SAMN05216308_11166 [Nitrosospira sp. Nsp13]
MARWVARQFFRLGEAYSVLYGCRASNENGRKPATSTRAGSENLPTDYRVKYSMDEFCSSFLDPEFSVHSRHQSSFTACTRVGHAPRPIAFAPSKMT